MGSRETGTRDPIDFWASQRASLHRRSDKAFYSAKASEHVNLMTEQDRELPIVDFACGAGELLEHMTRLVNIDAASDFSGMMLAEASRRLSDQNVNLIQADGLSHAKSATQPVWTTCGGINQYLAPADLKLWIEAFAKSHHARSLYLFDCVDPLRFWGLRDSSSYVGRMGDQRLSRRLVRRVRASVRLASSGESSFLGSAAMGYGYTPRHMRDIATLLGLEAAFYSSQQYEYRFHTVLRKTRASQVN